MSELLTSKERTLPDRLRDATWRYHPESVLAVMLTTAADELEKLGKEITRITRGDVSPIITTLGDALTYISQLETRLAHETAAPRPEPFVVKHYVDDVWPSIKGNGFDGLEIGETREEAQEFIDWVNTRIM